MTDGNDELPHTFQLQVLDGEGNFNNDLSSELDKWSKKFHFRDFVVVSVMGSQSSGKSLIYFYLFFYPL